MDNIVNNMMLNNEQIECNWAELLELAKMHNPSYKMCVGLENDRMAKNCKVAGFKNAPAGVGQHHHYPGGLVEHLLEMWKVFQQLSPILPSETTAEMRDSDVFLAILIHDLHKAYKTYRYLNIEEKVGKNEHRTFAYSDLPHTKLLTADQQSAMILSMYNVNPPLIVLNSLYCSEGGYKEAPPNACSALALSHFS
jgi:hypothetical protein